MDLGFHVSDAQLRLPHCRRSLDGRRSPRVDDPRRSCSGGLAAGGSYAKTAAALDGVVAFAVDIDEGVVFPAYGKTPLAALDLDERPQAREVVDRIDGEILETIGRLWYAGKGWPDPEEKRREAERIELPDWKRGDLVAWDEALVGVRQDMFRLGDRVFEAVDLYCVEQGCSCGEAVLEFAPMAPRGLPPPGAVRIDKSGQCTLEPTQERHGERLEELWAAFQKRHPRYRERFARRAAVMQGLSGRIVGAPSTGIERRAAKVGRNDPCPCGSGRKYKKCCGAS